MTAPLAWIDAHCHLQFEGRGSPPEEQVARAADAGVERMVCIGTDLPTSREAVRLAGQFPEVWATVGLHPHDASKLAGEWDGLVELASAERGLPLIIHSRDAWPETFGVLQSEGVPDRTVFHCFTGGPTEAERALELGTWLSYSGIVSFKTAGDLRAAAALTPSDRLLVETDAPFLAPVPHRGKPNEPAFLPAVGAALAAARNEPLESVAAATRRNALAFFWPAEAGG